MEPSQNSTPSARKNTGRTEEKFLPDEALQILEKALKICQAAGVPVHITPIHDQGEISTGILLKQTRIGPGRRLEYTGNPPKNTGNTLPVQPDEEERIYTDLPR